MTAGSRGLTGTALGVFHGFAGRVDTSIAPTRRVRAATRIAAETTEQWTRAWAPTLHSAQITEREMTAPASIVVPAPIDAGPTMTARSPISAPAPTMTGPTSSADGWIRALGWMVRSVRAMRRWLSGMAANAGVLAQLLSYLWKHGMWWMIPMVSVLVIFGILLVFATTSGIGPFIYTLF